MTRRRVLLLALLFLSALIPAYLLHDLAERVIIVPLVYLWWLLRLYYSILPQLILWLLLIVVVLISAAVSLAPRFNTQWVIKPEVKPAPGQIENLVGWLEKSQRNGNYYKWLIANRLGKTAREILAQREGQPVSKKFGRLAGRDWAPPQKIDDYLDSGLNGSFGDFPRPAWSRRGRPQKNTPLDMDPGQVLEFLENEMKTDTRHKP